MTKNELMKYIKADLKTIKKGYSDIMIWKIDELDFLGMEDELKALSGSKYAVFIEQSFMSIPIQAHFEPVPMELNSMIEAYGLW